MRMGVLLNEGFKGDEKRGACVNHRIELRSDFAIEESLFLLRREEEVLDVVLSEVFMPMLKKGWR